MDRRYWWILSAVLLPVVTICAYWPGLDGPFIFDDVINIIFNPKIQITELTFANLRDAALSSHSGPLQRPLAMLSFALNYYFAGFNLFAFKFTNLVIHLLTGLALYALTFRVLSDIADRPGTLQLDRRRLQWMSLAITAVWLLHPLNLTSVLYVVQRMNSLAALFTVLGLLGYCAGRRAIIAGRTSGFLVIIISLAVGTTFAALSKENGVLLPLYALGMELIVYRLKAESSLSRPFFWFFVSVFIVPLAVVAVVLVWKSGTLLAMDAYQYRNFTLGERLLTEARVFWFYLRLIALPDINQMGAYHDDFGLSHGLTDPLTTLFSVFGVAALVVAMVIARRAAPVLSFGLMWFFVGHSLESTIIPLELVHEHRNYLPQYGILLILVYYILYPYKYFGERLHLRIGVIGVFIILITAATFARSLQWSTEFGLYLRDVQNHPDSARANSTFGILLHDNKKYAEAEYYFTRAANLDSTSPDQLLRLMQHLSVARGKIPENALDELEHRLQRYRYSTVTLWIFEPLLRQARVDPEAHRRLVKLFANMITSDTVKLPPEWQSRAFSVLAENYSYLKQYQLAVDYYEKALLLEPRAAFHLAIAKIDMKTGDKKDAAARIRKVIDNNLPLSDSDVGTIKEIKSQLGAISAKQSANKDKNHEELQ